MLINQRMKRLLTVFAMLFVPAVVFAAQRPDGAPPIYLPAVNQAPSSLPVFAYDVAMRDGFKHEANQPNLAHYDLSIRIDPATRQISGHADIWFRNTTGAPLNDAMLRLYPNFPADYSGDGGNTRMTVTNMVAQGRPALFSYQAQDTAVRVALPLPVAPNDAIRLEMDFATNFTTFHPQDRSFALPEQYPMLAAWQNGWRTDVSTFPDKVYSNSGVYHARVTVPTGWTVVSTGSTTNTTANSDGTTTFEAVSGPVREFAMSVGRFNNVQAEHEGTLIVVWYEQSSGLADVAQPSVEHLKRALTTFNQRYGPYPYRTLETHLILDTRSYNYGYEMPGLVYIMSNGTYSSGTRIVLSHELAHQWYYGVLGDDIFNEPWLDEAFAQYSPYWVEQQWYGQAAADVHYRDRIRTLSDRATKPAGLSVWQYSSWRDYHNTVYGKGANFLHTLRGRVGDAAFFGALQDLFNQRKYGVIHQADVLRVMEARSGQDLDALFVQWLGR